MIRTDQTLVEQMQISDTQIHNRKELLDLSLDDLKTLTDLKIFIEENIDLIVESFYEQQIKVDEIALLIGDVDTLLRLKASMRKYILDMFGGFYDSDYVNNRLRIGMVHKRIGVEPKLYLSAVRTLKDLLSNMISNEIDDPNLLRDTLDTLDKLFYFDTTLVVDTYIASLIGEVEAAKKKTELYAKSLEDKVAQRTKQLEELAMIDSLTNIYNRRAMYEHLRSEFATANRNKTNLTIIYFDIDNFKQINDIEGHAKGDEVLKKIGQILLKHTREVDSACRYGGDEFVLILPNSDIESAKVVCQKVIKEFSQKYDNYYLSMGIAQMGEGSCVDIDELIKIADKNMYQAKKEIGFAIRY